MKILNIVFSMTLFVLLVTSMTLADGAPLKVEASLQTGSPFLSITVTNVSNIDQEFYDWSCGSVASLITDNPSIQLVGGPVLQSNFLCRTSLIKIILKPSDIYKFWCEGGIVLKYNGQYSFKTKTIIPAFKIGFIYLNQDGKRDTSKEVVWSDPLKVYVP